MVSLLLVARNQSQSHQLSRTKECNFPEAMFRVWKNVGDSFFSTIVYDKYKISVVNLTSIAASCQQEKSFGSTEIRKNDLLHVHISML